MHALGDPGKLSDLLSRDRNPLCCRISSSLKSGDQGVWNVGSGNLLVDETGVLGRLEQKHPGQNRELHRSSHVTAEALQHVGIHHHLRLNEPSTRFTLALQPALEPRPTGTVRISGSPSEQSGGTIGQAVPDRVFPTVEGAHLLQQTHGFQLMHRARGWLIPCLHRIPCETKQIADPERMGTEQISLHPDAIAVTSCHLQHGLQAGIQEQTADRQTAHAHHRTAAVSDIDGLNPVPQEVGHGEGMTGISPARRHHLRGDGDGTSLKTALQRGTQTLRMLLMATMQDRESGMMPRMGQTESSVSGMVNGDGHGSSSISLSTREIEIIELVAEGLTNQEIAERLTISKRTVDNHVSNVFTKTGSKNRVALLNWAMDHGKICRDGFNCCLLPESSVDAP